jgi:ribonuclease HII
MLAMLRAVEALSMQPNKVLVDGNKTPDWQYDSEAIVKGDGKIAEISAASIIAKVTRDRELIELDRRHPEYGFAGHKGYPTKQHLQAIADHGVLVEHRRSFGPVQRALQHS